MDPVREIWEAEKFDLKIQKLSSLTMKEKKKKLRQIQSRETTFEKSHSEMNWLISEERKFSEAARQDENWNWDQLI